MGTPNHAGSPVPAPHPPNSPFHVSVRLTRLASTRRLERPMVLEGRPDCRALLPGLGWSPNGRAPPLPLSASPAPSLPTALVLCPRALREAARTAELADLNLCPCGPPACSARPSLTVSSPVTVFALFPLPHLLHGHPSCAISTQPPAQAWAQKAPQCWLDERLEGHSASRDCAQRTWGAAEFTSTLSAEPAAQAPRACLLSEEGGAFLGLSLGRS